MKLVGALPLVGCAALPASADGLVAFGSPSLKAAVEAQRHIANPTAADTLTLSYLVAEGRGIAGHWLAPIEIRELALDAHPGRTVAG